MYIVLTCVGSEAEVTPPVSGVDERDIRVDVGSAHPTADYHVGVNNWTLLNDQGRGKHSNSRQKQQCMR